MNKYYVTVNGTRYQVEVEEVKGDFEETSEGTQKSKIEPLKKSEVKKLKAEGEKIVCPMPGTLLKVNISSGDNVKRGDTLFVLEAMKMETEIKAPHDAKIIEVYENNGVQINTGDVLAVIK